MLIMIGKYLKKVITREPGFSLIELLIVIVIIGILAAVSVPIYTRYITTSQAAIAFNGISAIIQHVEGFRIASSTGTAYPASGDIVISDIVQNTRNFTFSYTGSTVAATGRGALTTDDIITFNLSSGTWNLEGILSGVSISSQ